MKLTDVGNLMCLYMDEIDPGEGTTAPEFLIQATAKLLNQTEERNWVPVIVQETGKAQYKVIGNAFIYAVAEAAGLERVWCIIAEATDSALQVTKVLTGETIPQVNLSAATRDEIAAALKYLVDQPGSPLKGIKLAVATNRIEEDPCRKYWKSLNSITKLSCGITRGKKLDALKQVFYLAPEPYPPVIQEPALLETFTATELKAMAKQRQLTIPKGAKKTDLVHLLST